METLLWLDGHTSTIDADEAFFTSYTEPTDDGDDAVIVMFQCGHKFEWHNNMWMQVD